MGYVYQGTMVDLGSGRGWMNGPAAASQFRMDRALGHPQQITEAGRTWDQQNAHYQNYLRYGSPIALSPDAPSLHQMGNAKDTNERPGALHNDHGWYLTVYRWVNGVWTLVEPWHFEYFPERDNHIGEPTGSGEVPFPVELPDEEDDMLMLNAKVGGNTHKVALGVGILRHFLPTDPYEMIMRLSRSRDDWQDVSEADFNPLLRTYGIDLEGNVAYKVTASGEFQVLDPRTGQYKGGNVWTIENARFADHESETEPSLPDPTPEPEPEPPVVVYPAPITPAGGWPQGGYNSTSRPTAEIQRALIEAKFLPPKSDDGQYGPQTSEAAAKFQQTRWLYVDGVWGQASDGTAFPPAGSIHGIDYSFARPDPKMVAARGVRFVARYLWPAKYASKGLTRKEYDALKAQGLEVVFIYEEDGKELAGGWEAGVGVANKAQTEYLALGFPDVKNAPPIYFNVDYDAPTSAMPAILQALQGAASVIGKKRVGLYAGIGPIKAAFDADVITWGFQTYAWSNGKWDSRAQLQQWANGQWNDTVDFTRAMTKEYGQNGI